MGIISSFFGGVLKFILHIFTAIILMVFRFAVILVLLVFVIGAAFGNTPAETGLQGKLDAGIKNVESIYDDLQKYSELATKFKSIGGFEKIITNPDALANFNETADLLDADDEDEFTSQGMQEAVKKVLSKSPDEMMGEVVSANRVFSESPDKIINSLKDNMEEDNPSNLSQAAEEQFSKADEIIEKMK